MRPILVQVPSKLLFFAALALAAILFARDLINRQRVPGSKLGANPLLLIAAALAIVKFRSPTASFIPETGTFSLGAIKVVRHDMRLLAEAETTTANASIRITPALRLSLGDGVFMT